jgi:hypothetical protein
MIFLIFTFSSKVKGWDNAWPGLVAVPTRKMLLFIAAVGRDDGLYTARYQIYIRIYLRVGSCAGY